MIPKVVLINCFSDMGNVTVRLRIGLNVKLINMLISLSKLNALNSCLFSFFQEVFQDTYNANSHSVMVKNSKTNFQYVGMDE